MCKIKCFDKVSQIVEYDTIRFEPSWVVNQTNLDILKKYCEVIDSLGDEFDGEFYEAGIDDVSMEIFITLECSAIIINSKKHNLYELIRRSTDVTFSPLDNNDNILVKFVFPSVWEKSSRRMETLEEMEKFIEDKNARLRAKEMEIWPELADNIDIPIDS